MSFTSLFLTLIFCSYGGSSCITISLLEWQVKKREKMAKLREEIAVQKAKETELNKTIHITGSVILY